MLVDNFATRDGKRMVYRYQPEFIDGQTIGDVEILDRDDVIHVSGFGFDGFGGMPRCATPCGAQMWA